MSSDNKATVNFKELKTFNFKSLPDNVAIPFTKKTIIEGPNGIGKTSIQQAFIACFTGLTAIGKNNLEEYKRDNKKPLAINVILNIEQSNKNLKCAVKLEMKTNKKVFFFNGKKIAHSALLEKFKINKPKQFMASISPTFTMSMSDSELVELITESNTNRIALAQKYLDAKELKKINKDNLKESFKKIRDKRLGEQKDIANLENEISYLNGQIEAFTKIAPTEINYDAKKHDKANKAFDASTEIERIKNEIHDKLFQFDNIISNMDNDTDKEEAENAATELNKLKAQEKKITDSMSKITKIKRPQIPPEYEKQLQQWEKIVIQKNELTIALKQNKTRQDKSYETISKFDPDQTSEMESKKEEYNERRDNFLIQKANEIKKLEKLTSNKTFQELQEQVFIFNNAKKNKNPLKSSKPVQEKLKIVQDALNRKQNSYNSLYALERKIKDLPKRELEERATEIIAKFPKNAKIKIETSDNEDNPCFRITKNGHPFNWLSTSEKSRIMGIVSTYISEKSGIPFRSIFIDNAEMFSSEIKGITSQTILARVGTDKLTINGKELS